MIDKSLFLCYDGFIKLIFRSHPRRFQHRHTERQDIMPAGLFSAGCAALGGHYIKRFLLAMAGIIYIVYYAGHHGLAQDALMIAPVLAAVIVRHLVAEKLERAWSDALRATRTADKRLKLHRRYNKYFSSDMEKLDKDPELKARWTAETEEYEALHSREMKIWNRKFTVEQFPVIFPMTVIMAIILAIAS